jgi:hypothetical protein
MRIIQCDGPGCTKHVEPLKRFLTLRILGARFWGSRHFCSLACAAGAFDTSKDEPGPAATTGEGFFDPSPALPSTVRPAPLDAPAAEVQPPAPLGARVHQMAKLVEGASLKYHQALADNMRALLASPDEVRDSDPATLAGLRGALERLDASGGRVPDYVAFSAEVTALSLATVEDATGGKS